MIDVPVLVKDALREGIYRKAYRFNVLNSDGSVDFTLSNDNLVYESVKIDERMCSGNDLKFGLCEGSSLEFQYFFTDRGDYVANQFYQENDLVHYDNKIWRSKVNSNRYHWPTDVEDAEKYWAEWTTTTINNRQLQAFVDVGYEEYSTTLQKNEVFTVSKAGNYVIHVPMNSPYFIIAYTPYGGEREDTISYGTVESEEFEFDNCSVNDTFEILSAKSNPTVVIAPKYGVYMHSIPMGFFTVEKCSRQASTGIQKVTAYNKLQSQYLDEKANILIESMSSDTFQDGVVTSRGVIDALLDDFFIDYRKPNEMELTVGFGYGYFQKYAISFSMAGQSYSYVYLISSTDTRMAPTISVTSHELLDKRVKITDLKKYLNKLNQSVTEMKAAIQTKVSNPDTFWSALASSPLGLFACSIMIGYRENNVGKNAYFLLDEIYNKGVTYSAYTKPLSKLYSIVNTDIIDISLFMPSGLYGGTSSTYYTDDAIYENSNVFTSADFPTIQVWDNGDSIDNISINVSNLPDVTLREIASSNYELHCQYGQLNRVTDLFSGVELNQSALYPRDNLYPANDLYPGGIRESSFKSQYSKLWTDKGGEQSFRYLIITYKGLDENQQEKDYILQRTINANGTTDYNMSDNWMFRNLVWDAATVGDYADAMVAKMQNITWFPFEMWAAGLPYIETGDMIEVNTAEGTYTSYILQRQLSGIQNLQDTFVNGELDVF